MGPLFVIFFWILLGGVLSILGGFFLAFLVRFLLRGIPTGQGPAIVIGAVLPAFGFAYLFGSVLVFSLWSAARDRDWGWGDSWDTPLLGDYHLMMIDLTDQGTIYNKADPTVYRNGSVSGSPDQQDVVFGVTRMEVRPPYFLGAASNDQSFPRKDDESRFFILDTRSGARTDETSLASLQTAAQRLGSPLELEPVETIYNRYRYRLVDLIPVAFLAIPPLAAGIFLLRAFLKLRATRQVEPMGSN